MAGGTAAEERRRAVVVTYSIRVAPTAARELAKRMPEPVCAACVRFAYGPLAADPRGVGTPLRDPFDGYWTTERGEYRIYYRIDDAAAVIDIVDMTHRNPLALQRLEH